MKKKLFNRIMAFCLSSAMILSNCSSMASAIYAKEDVAVNTTTDAIEETSEEVTTEDNTTEEVTTEEMSTEEESTEIVFDHFYNDDADVSNIKSKDLFVQADDATVFTKNTNVVSNYGDVYIISCKSVEEAQYVYSYYVDKVNFICDLQNTVELSDEENTDVADLSDVNKDSEDAIGNLENNIDEAIDALSDVKEKDYSDYIAIIDSGINEEDVTLDDKDVALSVIGDDTNDTIGHGTKMYQYVKEEYPDAKIMAIKAFDKKTTDVASIYAAIKLAIENKVAIINLSFVGVDVEDNAIIKEVIQEAINNNITVIGAAGNASQSAKEYIPGCIDDAITVGAVNEDGTLYKTSNYDADLYTVATSTSEATARYSGIFASGNTSNKVFFNFIDNKDISEDVNNDAIFNANNLVKDTYFNVKYTYVTNNTINKIDDLFDAEGNTKDYFIYQSNGYYAIYEYDNYYYCKLDIAKNKGISPTILDYCVANANDNGEVITSTEVDLNNYYIKFNKSDFNNSDFENVIGQIQLLVPYENTTNKITINHYSNNKIINTETIDPEIFTDTLYLNNINTDCVTNIFIDGKPISINENIKLNNPQEISTIDIFYKNTTFMVSLISTDDRAIPSFTANYDKLSDYIKGNSHASFSGNAVFKYDMVSSNSKVYVYDSDGNAVSTSKQGIDINMKIKALGARIEKKLPCYCVHVDKPFKYGEGSRKITISYISGSVSSTEATAKFKVVVDTPVSGTDTAGTSQQATTIIKLTAKNESRHVYFTKYLTDDGKSKALGNVVFRVTDSNDGDYIGYMHTSNTSGVAQNIYQVNAVKNNDYSSQYEVNTKATNITLTELGYPVYRQHSGGTSAKGKPSQLVKTLKTNATYYFEGQDDNQFKFTLTAGGAIKTLQEKTAKTANGKTTYYWKDVTTGRKNAITFNSNTSNGYFILPIRKMGTNQYNIAEAKIFSLPTYASANNAKTANKIINDDTYQMSLALYKASMQYHEPLSGAQYKIYYTNGQTPTYINGGNAFTTNNNGVITYTNSEIKSGITYYAEEVTPPDGYLKTPKPIQLITYPISLEDANSINEINDRLAQAGIDINTQKIPTDYEYGKPVYISVKKVDKNNNPIPGVKFNVEWGTYYGNIGDGTTSVSEVNGSGAGITVSTKQESVSSTVTTDDNGVATATITGMDYHSTFAITFKEVAPDSTNAAALAVWNYTDNNGNKPNQNVKISYFGIGYTRAADAETNATSYTVSNDNAYRIAIKKSPETVDCVDVTNNPNYDLTGATYKVYKADTDTNAILTFTVDKDGYSVPQDIYDYMDKNDNGSPIDTVFYVKEVTPGARGYKRNRKVKQFKVKADHSAETTYTVGNTTYYGVTVCNTTDEPVQDPANLYVRKLDGFGNESTALQGTVKLKYTFYKSAMYDTILSRNDLINNHSADIVSEYSGTLNTNEKNRFDMSGLRFPRGYLVIDEIEWPKDYTGDKSVNIILADGKTINITNDFYFVTDNILTDNGTNEDMITWYPNGETTYANLLKDDTKAIKVQDGNDTNLEIRMSDPNVRGDIELYKYNEITGEPMEGVKFSITNRFTGEKHYIYTDKNGHATTKVEYDPNKTYLENYGHINYYDTVDDYDPTITDATVWFGWTKDYNNEDATDAEKIVTPDRWQFDFPGAVWGSEDADDLFGTYIVKEERCAANTNVTIDGETYKYQLLLPYNSVHVTNMNEIKLVYDNNALRAENKNYNTKLPEIYTKARVIETSNDVEEISDDGTVTTVKDYSQTLANNSNKDIIPANTNNANTDANDGNASKVIDYTDQTIEDDVFYDKLRAGTTYAVLSELKVITETLDDNGKPTGEITIDDAIDRDGNVCKQMTKFTTKADYDLSVYEIKGTHTVRFEHIDPTGLDEKCQYYVVYETIYLDEDYKDLAALEEAITNKTFKTRYDEYTEKDDMDFFPIVHTDEKDEAQTIWPNVLHTTAANNPTVDHVANAEDKVRITDRVYYKGLTVGKEYTITGDIVVKDGTDFTTITYDPTNEKADADGFVTTTTTEKPAEEAPNGDETVHPNGPANDANNNNDTDANANANTDNNNTEAYNTDFEQNPNKAYFLRDADGNVITASTTIKIESEEQRNGYVDIVFEFNASELESKSTVVFEKLEYGNKIINIHADLNDEDQTIHFPKIGTSTRNGKIKAEDIVSDEVNKETTNTTENTTNTNETTNNETTTNETNTNNETNTTTTDTNTTDTNTTEKTDNVTKLDIGKAVAKEVKASDGESFIDTIHYDNLLANRTYHAYGKLMDKETGEVMKDAAGKEIVADVIFKTNKVSAVVIDKAPLSVNYVLENGTILDLTADHADYRCDGDVELEFKGYDFTNLANKIGVVFEEIYLVKDTSDKFIDSEGNEVETGTEVLVGSHKDIKDITQFIYFAKIGTNAKDGTTDIPLVPYGMDTVLKDTVNYENLIPGKEYTLTANIAVKDDKSGTYKDGELLKDANGNVIVATTKLIPTAENSTINADGTASGSTLVEIPFNTTGLKGVKLVAFEDMSNMYGISIATHMDINDEGQTVRVPGGYTTVVDDETQSQIVAADKEMTVTDTIYYENLIPGKEYTATGTVYVKETGEQLMVDGQPVTSTVTFTPTDSTGTVKVPFTINTSDLYTKHLVFFEDVTYNNITVFVHHDLNDDKQTLTVEMVMNIKVAKADKDNIKYFIKGAEITIYNEDGTIAKDINGENCVGITDENGNVSFKVVYREDNTYYAQETKAPNGYAINNEKFKITATGEKDTDHCDIIKVTILDEAIVIPPKTGDILLITMICLVALGALGIFVYRRKKSKVD